MARTKAQPAVDDSPPPDTTLEERAAAQGELDDVAAPVTNDAPPATDDAPPPVEPVAEVPVETPPPQEAPSGWWSQFGAQNEQQALVGIGQMQARLQQYEHQLRIAAAQERQRQEAEAQRAQEQATSAEPWYTKHWKPPEFNQAVLSEWTERNPETGKMQFRADTPDAIKQAYAEHTAYQQEFHRRLNENPPLRTYEMLESPIRQLIRQEQEQFWQENFGQYQQHVEAQRTLESQAQWMFEKDQQGNPQFGRLSPLGRVYGQHVLSLSQQFPGASQQAIHNQAIQLTDLDYRRSQQSQPGPEQQAAAATETKGQYINGAAAQGAPRAGQRTGTQTAAKPVGGPIQNPHRSLMDQWLSETPLAEQAA